MEIRLEQDRDIAQIRSITKAAFNDLEHSSQTEAEIIDALRQAGALTISLVALDGPEVVGHVAFSPIRIDGHDHEWFGLGPVSVRPDRQKGGVGSALIRDGLDRLRAMGAKGCVVLGDPAYYSRFGFESDPALRYEDAPAQYFKRVIFAGSAPAGAVSYHAGFEAK